MKTRVKTIDEYISGFPNDTREILELIRKTVRDTVPHAKETIKYNMPAFTTDRGDLIYFSAFKNHIGFYPAPTNDKNYQNDLSGYKTGKGSVQFPLNRPIPLDLIVKIVKWRMERS